jgi:hypothetical protein
VQKIRKNNMRKAVKLQNTRPRRYTDKKGNINFTHIEGNSDGSGCKVIYEEGLSNIYEEMSKYLTILEEAFSHIVIDFEFPYLRGKFYFLFYQCSSRAIPLTEQRSAIYTDQNRCAAHVFKKSQDHSGSDHYRAPNF